MPHMTIREDIISAIASVNAFQIILILTMILGWTSVYILTIIRQKKDKLIAMPWVALCLNISWELIYSLVVPYPDPMYRLGFFFWVVLDSIMFVQAIKYGKEDFCDLLPGLEKYYIPIQCAIFLIFFVMVFSANYQWTALPDATGHTAYIMQIVMSFTYITALFRRQNTIRGMSIYIAIAKLLGSLAPTLLGMTTLPSAYPFPYAIGICSTILDIFYLAMLYKHFINLGYSPWTRKPLTEQ